jgi:hypothetical protein
VDEAIFSDEINLQKSCFSLFKLQGWEELVLLIMDYINDDATHVPVSYSQTSK